MPRIVERSIARADREGIAVYIGKDRSAAAVRFLAAARKALELLATMPEMGTILEFETETLSGIRYFAIPRFKNYVIFYRPLYDGIEVLRILHGARDIRSLLDADK